MDYRKAAQGVLDNIGGPSNIVSAAHCATRLRLVIADNSKVDKAAVEEVEGVKGAFEASGQLQVIFGTGIVNKVYDEFISLSGASEATKADVKEAAAQKQNPFFRAIKTLGDVFVPIIPAIVASGLLNGLIGGLGNIPALQGFVQSDWISLINLFAGAALSMLPILIAISAADKFGGNKYLAAVIGFIMIHPSLINAWSVAGMDAADIPVWHFFGLTIRQTGYQGHVIPVIIAILFMSVLEKWLHKHVPEIIDLFVTPLVTVLVTGLVTMIVIGPIFSTVEGWILTAAQFLIKIPFGIGGLLVGGLYALTVVAGFHHMYNMIEAQMVSNGLNTWMPVATAANVAQGAAALAVAFKSKNKKTKELAMPSSLSAFLGITEPAIFGVNIRFMKPFVAACIGGAAGGMIAAWTGIGVSSYGITGLFGFLIAAGKNPVTGEPFNYLLQYALVMLVAFVVAFAVSFITFKDPEPAAKKTAEPVTVKEETVKKEAAEEAAPAPAADAAPKKVFAPLKGKVIAASEISDPMFAAEALGKCAAIIPEEGRVVAPFDGTVELMYDTGHAVAVTSDDGIEVLIHIGVDTVKLDGKGFTPHCKTGDKVSKGDLLVEFDRDVIKAAGYDNVTPVIVTNTDDYTEVKAVEPGEVNEGDQILEII